MTTGEPFYEAAVYIADAIQSHAPNFTPELLKSLGIISAGTQSSYCQTGTWEQA
jgi:hypothetical protein